MESNCQRGKKTVRENIRENTQNNDSKVRDIQNTLNRFNIGRGSNSIGRNLVVGYDRNRLNGNTRSIGNSKRNNRPGINTNSLTRDARQPRSNNTISNSSTRSPIGLSRVSGSAQTQYRLIERNPYNRSSPRVQQNSNSNRFRSQPKSSNPRSSYRIVRNSNRNKNKNSVNYSNNRTQRSNNYSRSNNSYTNYRSSTPSYNSGGGRSAGRGSSSGSRGRTN